jgi:hypothetical protein
VRRGALIAVATVVTVVAILGLLAFFNSRDDATIGEDRNAPGQVAPDATSPELEQGNVVIRYRDAADRPKLRELAASLGGGDPALREAGQAVVVRAGNVDGIVAEAYKRRLTVSSPDDPALSAFAEYWLGRGAMP